MSVQLVLMDVKFVVMIFPHVKIALMGMGYIHIILIIVNNAHMSME